MNVSTDTAPRLRKSAVPLPEACVALIGCGKVGSALLRIVEGATRVSIKICGIANSTVMSFAPWGIPPSQVRGILDRATRANDLDALAAELQQRTRGRGIMVDATASRGVAARHEPWLTAGLHVVTANKLAASDGLSGEDYPAYYGDAATVGAGLPVLHALRRLRAAGDRVQRIEGILSGSLAYLFHALEQGSSFGLALRAAQRAGYTEPDPSVDLSGVDVWRKLAILASTAGFACRRLPPPDAVARRTDAYWREKVEAAACRGRVLRYVARIDKDRARIGVREIERCDPLAQTRGTENLVAIYSQSYHSQPLVIRGPGAGPEVTARALLADIVGAAAVRTPVEARFQSPAGAGPYMDGRSPS